MAVRQAADTSRSRSLHERARAGGYLTYLLWVLNTAVMDIGEMFCAARLSLLASAMPARRSAPGD
jgi:hypothetical protein